MAVATASVKSFRDPSNRETRAGLENEVDDVRFGNEGGGRGYLICRDAVNGNYFNYFLVGVGVGCCY